MILGLCQAESVGTDCLVQSWLCQHLISSELFHFPGRLLHLQSLVTAQLQGQSHV